MSNILAEAAIKVVLDPEIQKYKKELEEMDKKTLIETCLMLSALNQILADDVADLTTSLNDLSDQSIRLAKKFSSIIDEAS